MFSSLLDSTSETAARPPASVPAALALHALLILAVLAASYASIAIPRDPLGLRPITFITILPPPAPESPGQAAAAGPKPLEVLKPRPSPPETTTQPLRVPDVLPTPPAPEADSTPVLASESQRGTAGPTLGRGDGPEGPGEGSRGGEGTSASHGPPTPWSEVPGSGSPPQLLVKVEPHYPEVMRVARLEGRVLLRAIIGEDGNVEAVEILRSSSPAFEAAAMTAVTRWRYSPAMQNGRPVKVYVAVIVDFRLE